MKRIIIIISFTLALISCLKLDPKSSLTSSNYWKSESDVENAVTSIYYSLSKSLARGCYDWGELRGGNYSGNQPNGPDQYDIINNIITSSNSATLWSNLYQTIGRANLVLKYAPDVKMQAAKKSGFLSECYAIRALCYFYIVRVWGDAPLFLEPVEEYTPQNVYRPRTSTELLLQQIENDLELAEMYAQPITNAKFKRSRINIMSIYAIMADVYSWRHEYDKVLALMEKVYTLAPESSNNAYWKTLTVSPSADQSTFTSNWKAIFSKFENGTALDMQDKERIFYLHYDELENGVNGNTSYFCVGVSKANPTEKLLSMFETGDKRYAATFRSGNPVKISMKFWPDGVSFGTGGIVSDGDIVLYRMSDLVLLHAEAYAATNQLDKSVTQLNKIRTRAGLPAYIASDFISSEDAILAILKERTVEFVGEGKYWFDLLRTGHAGDLGGITNPDKYLFPIAKTHLDENNKLTQNPGYGAGE